MSISSITSASNLTYTSDLPGNPGQVRADFQALGNALKSGDVSSAQDAFTKLQKDAPWIANALNGQNGQNTSSNTASDNLASLASALQSGDLSGAQKAFTALQQAAPHGHRHPHKGSEGGATSALGQDFKSLASSLQSGDLTGAQDAFAAIQTTQQSQSDQTGSNTSNANSRSHFQSLATALQSGDLGAAQQAFASILQAHRENRGVPLYSADGANDTAATLGGDLINTSA